MTASARGGSGEHALPRPAAAVTDTPPAPASITAAPPTPDAPPANIQAGAVSDQWDARLMARLERYRYPAAARRQQGTAWVRASIGRTGRLLSLRLEQSSGQPELDAAALQTFRRAQPLPPIPDELKAPQERVVPVEYYLR